MSSSKKVRLFISHSWDYSDEYVTLIKFLRRLKEYTFYNYSVPKYEPLKADNEKELIDELCEQLRGCHILVVLGTMRPSYSEWIQKEILIANVYNKPVLVIIPWGQRRISSFCRTYSDKIVGWRTNSIRKAIKELMEEFQ